MERCSRRLNIVIRVDVEALSLSVDYLESLQRREREKREHHECDPSGLFPAIILSIVCFKLSFILPYGWSICRVAVVLDHGLAVSSPRSPMFCSRASHDSSLLCFSSVWRMAMVSGWVEFPQGGLSKKG